MAGSSNTNMSTWVLTGTVLSIWGDDINVTMDDKLHMTETSLTQTVQSPMNFSNTSVMTFAGSFTNTNTGINTFAGPFNNTSTSVNTFNGPINLDNTLNSESTATFQSDISLGGNFLNTATFSSPINATSTGVNNFAGPFNNTNTNVNTFAGPMDLNNTANFQGAATFQDTVYHGSGTTYYVSGTAYANLQRLTLTDNIRLPQDVQFTSGYTLCYRLLGGEFIAASHYEGLLTCYIEIGSSGAPIGVIPYVSSPTTVYFYSPSIVLPHGAVVTEVRIRWKSTGSNSTNSAFHLMRAGIDDDDLASSLASDYGVTTSWTTEIETSITNEVINNSSYRYFLRILKHNECTTINIASLRIKYTVTDIFKAVVS